MAKRVQCFVYSHQDKIGKGFLEFFEDKTYKDYHTKGGALVLRSNEGDVSVTVKPQAPPMSEEYEAVCEKLKEWKDKLYDSIENQPKSVQDEMNELISLLRQTHALIKNKE